MAWVPPKRPGYRRANAVPRRCDRADDERRALTRATFVLPAADSRRLVSYSQAAPSARSPVSVSAVATTSTATEKPGKNAEAPPSPLVELSNSSAPRTRPAIPAENPVSMDDVQAIVLAGGPDAGNPLTRFQTRGALRFGATYRLIDFPLANCINSKMKRVFVLTQWNSHSLNQHVHAAYPPEVFGVSKSAGCVPCPLPLFSAAPTCVKNATVP